MCGRFNLTDSPAVHALLDDLGVNIGELPTRYNITPTEPVLTIYEQDGKYLSRNMRWWLVPRWADAPSQKFAMFNARSETIENSRAHKTPYKK